MELIIGGAFQGKTAFTKENFTISDEEIFVCDKDFSPEFDKKCITHIERFSFWCVEHGFEPADYFFEHAENIEDKIIISDDISCGVVPIDAEIRAWREATGRANNFLAREADEVWRVFCGLGQKLK